MLRTRGPLVGIAGVDRQCAASPMRHGAVGRRDGKCGGIMVQRGGLAQMVARTSHSYSAATIMVAATA